MSLGWSAFWQNLFLLGIAIAILLTYLLSKRRENNEKEDAEIRTKIIQNALASKLGIDLDAEVANIRQHNSHICKSDTVSKNDRATKIQ